MLELARGLEIRATSFVGRLTLGDVNVTVQPKLSGAPFINLLRYAYRPRHLDLYKPVGYATENWSFQDLLIQQLTAEVAELLARGVHREYDRTYADLPNPRGRIEFDRLVGMTHWARAALPCVHYPRTDNNLLNQAVLAGLLHAIRITVHQTLPRGEIYLTDDNNAVALWDFERNEKMSFHYIRRNLAFLIQIGIRSIVRILKSEAHVHNNFRKYPRYCHLYMIGVLPEAQGKGLASALMNPVIQRMKEKSIPLFLETANRRNVDIYKKKGFKIFETLTIGDHSLFLMSTES